MKKWIVAFAVLAVGTAAATTSFDRVNALKEELKLHHVDGKKEDATLLAVKLASAAGNEPFVQGPLQEELAGLDATVSNTSLDKAVAFITGKKTETYCEGQGLVEMSAEHNDGSTSHIALERSSRVMVANSYSQIESGDWVYDFTDSYRHPSASDLLMVRGSVNSYHLKEVRNKPNGKTDSGEFSASWIGGKMSNSYSGNGEGPEPLPMYMALDYQLWGNTDMGYKIKFEPGFKDTQEFTEKSMTKDIILTSERTVGDLIPALAVTDSNGEEHAYTKCYPVKYVINLKKIEDRQLVVDGQVNKEAVKKTIKRNRSQIRTCYDKALDTDASLKGSVTFAWDINDRGRVTEARLASRSLTGNSELENRDEMIQCMVDKVKLWKFPPAPKGQEVHVSFPFAFRE